MIQIELQKLIIPKGELDAVSYFNAFIQESFRLHLISTEELERFQIQIIGLLSVQFNRYTSGFSSSVSEETAKRIQQSVLYSLGYYFKSLPDVEKGLQELKENSLEELYHRGTKLVEKACVKAKELLKTVQENSLDTEILAYHETLSKGLMMFFKDYETDYGAHETPASIDYPLSCDKMILTGVDYILDYLDKIQIENNICSCYPPEEITSLLKGYDLEYKELLFNIFDLVLTNSVGSLLLERSPFNLNITEYDRQYLQFTLAPLTGEEISERVDQTLDRLCEELVLRKESSLSNQPALCDESSLCNGPAICDSRFIDYIRQFTVNFKTRLIHALAANSLERLFLSSDDTLDTQLICFRDKDSLDDSRFRDISVEIRECRLVSDKIGLLKKDAFSLKDFIDLLEGDCFFDKEFDAVFQTMDQIQLALLMKKLPIHPADSDAHAEDDLKDWHRYFISFLNKMEPEERNRIRLFAKQLSVG